MDHGFTRRISYLGNGALVAGLGVILFTHLHVVVDIHQYDVLGSNLAEGRQHGLDKKFSRPRNARADVTVIIRQTLEKHDPVTERNFLFQLLKILFVAFHLNPPSQTLFTELGAQALASCLRQTQASTSGYSSNSTDLDISEPCFQAIQ